MEIKGKIIEELSYYQPIINDIEVRVSFKVDGEVHGRTLSIDNNPPKGAIEFYLRRLAAEIENAREVK